LAGKIYFFLKIAIIGHKMKIEREDVFKNSKKLPQLRHEDLVME